ncbi:MAG TPA: hypothetical protein VEL03_11185 [Streptosporangiaceae bacterium]|nr:hypothetical protein [Streptosporangiaceae bacterium]
MGVMYVYFAAPSDAAAADMAMRQGGPGGPVPVSPAVMEAMRAGDRQALRQLMRPQVRRSDAGVLVLEAKGVDPLVQMGTLAALLTGEQYDVVVGGPRSGRQVAGNGEGGPWVVTLTDELPAALTASTADQLAAVAVPWSQTEEFRGQAAPEALADFLLALAELARQALQASERLYCWICL